MTTISDFYRVVDGNTGFIYCTGLKEKEDAIEQALLLKKAMPDKYLKLQHIKDGKIYDE